MLLGQVLELDQGADAAEERQEDRAGADQAGRLRGHRAVQQAARDRPSQREREHEPAPGADAHPRISDTSSTSIGILRRYIATIRPSPITTSQAATTITISAKICPSPVPVMRLNAISARLPA